jgi:regulator of protease activity HflC (stomatin/prohibitin superfamily)
MKRSLIALGLVVVVFAIGWGWFRFYVPPGHMAVLTAKVGEPLPPGQILAGPSQQGIREEVLGEGRHFRNPLFYDWEILPAVTIPAGKVGIVVSQVGSDLPQGEFLAAQGQKGIWRRVLGPGRYRLNPYGYRIELIDAISVPIGYAGVVTGLSGKQAAPGEFAGPGEKGVRRDVMQPGLYYVNPKELRVDVLEIGVNQVSLIGEKGGEVITKAQMATQNAPMAQLSQRMLDEQKEKRMDYLAQRKQERPMPAPAAEVGGGVRPMRPPDASPALSLDQVVEFPSRDGFEISLDMTVEFELLPEHIAWIYQSYGDLPAVVDKIIMPQILSVSRLKGSAYRAKDFIVGEGREQFQNDLKETLARTLSGKRIVIHNALIRHVNVPMQILDPIQRASIAVEQNLTNKEKQNTARKQAELNTELGLIEQRREQVAQETEKLKAEIAADRERQVAQIGAEAQKQVAEIRKQTAAVQADKVRTLGQAQAEVVSLVQGETAAGHALKAAALGDPRAYTLWELANSLNGNVRVSILHAGDGTLWTDVESKTLGSLGGAQVLKQEDGP